jgi:RHS repeat-associated protein
LTFCFFFVKKKEEKRFYFKAIIVISRKQFTEDYNMATYREDNLLLGNNNIAILNDDEKIFVRVETETGQNEVIRYQYDNHLGSACLELNEDAEIISYEEYYPFGTTSYCAMNSSIEVSMKRYRFCGKERDEETGLYYFGARFYAPWICRFTAVDPMSDKYPSLSPYVYCNNNPIMIVDPDGRDWFKDEAGAVTWTDHTNKKEFDKSGTKGTYLGKTHTENGKYYSLFGQTKNSKSLNGKITQKIDNAFINYANYLEQSKSGGWSNGPFDAEIHDPVQASTDFSGVKSFNNSSFTTNENIYGPNEMGTYADMADIHFLVNGSQMKGKFESFSEGMNVKRITGNTGSHAISGNLLTMRNSSTNPLIVLRFGSKANVESFRNKFFKLFPNAK